MPSRSRALRESDGIVRAAFELARHCRIHTVLVSDLSELAVDTVESAREDERVLWISSSPEGPPGRRRAGDLVIHFPDQALSRISVVKVSLFMAVVQANVRLTESVVALTGAPRSRRFDTLVVMNPARDLAWLRRAQIRPELARIATNVLERLIHVALRFANEGLEGRAIGTAFVIGDFEELRRMTRQLVLNPCRGHPRRARDVHNPDFLDSLREFSALDGAFLVDERGVVEAAGAYLDPPTTRVRLRSGLGARHTAAAAMTARTASVAVVISESSGTVTVFHRGKTILELERPEPAPRVTEEPEVSQVRKPTGPKDGDAAG